jgi:ligand-binding sensor domain-containing protein
MLSESVHLNMYNIRKSLFLLQLIIWPLLVNAQYIDDWRVYSSYSTVNDISITDNGAVFVATQGGLFAYQTDATASTYQTLDGLHRLDVQQLAYHSASNQLFLAYMDGVIDVLDLETGRITTLRDLLRVDQFPSKTIHQLLIKDELLYVATDFGIIEYNINELYVQNSYVGLGSLARGTPVFALSIQDNEIAAATSKGVVVASLSDNLFVEDSWVVYSVGENLPSELITDVAHFSGSLYALSESSLYLLENEKWVQEEGINYLESLIPIQQPNGDDLLLMFNNRIMRRSSYTGTKIYQVPNVRGVRVTDLQNDRLLMGTTDLGLLDFSSPTEWEQFVPEGPYTNFFDGLDWRGDRLFAASSKNVAGNRIIDRSKGYYFYQNDSWMNYNAQNNEQLNQENFKQAYTTTQTDNDYFIGSWGSGVVKHNKITNAIQVYNASNSTLRGWEADNPAYVVVSGLAADTRDQVWLVSRYGNTPLYVYDSNQDTWVAHEKDRSVNTMDEYVGLFVDSNNLKWISLQSSTADGTGLLVLDTKDPMNVQDNRGIKLTTSVSNGNLPDNKVNAIIEDKSGEVWVGTARGIARFLFPKFIVDSKTASERQAQWLLNQDTSAVSRYLLRDVNVSAMAINGANQKWIGSVNQGLWLLNEDGSTILKRFTQDNSPLLSNNIVSITVNELSGEVFIATDRGLISLIDLAQSPKEDMGALKIYPNPFVYDRHERIIIEGLSGSTRIRILSADGLVLQELEAKGGRAEWDGRSFQGELLASGVYFAVAWDVEAGERGVGKVVIIR